MLPALLKRHLLFMPPQPNVSFMTVNEQQAWRTNEDAEPHPV